MDICGWMDIAQCANSFERKDDELFLSSANDNSMSITEICAT